MYENLFLIIIALIWIIGAVIQDLKKREVSNWWNFSLIAVALSYRAFLSILMHDYMYFIYGLIGFAVFFILANVFYYARIFAGGDAKLLMALGAVLPFSFSFYGNLIIFAYFISLLLICGSVYGLIYSFILVFRIWKDFKKEFLNQCEGNSKIIDVCFFTAFFLAIILLVFNQYLLGIIPLLLFLFPILYIYAKSVEEACLIKKIKIKDLTEGDWLYEEVDVGKVKGKKKIIEPNWEGLSAEELILLKKLKKGKVKIRQGIPFTPAFLFGFLVLIWLLI